MRRRRREVKKPSRYRENQGCYGREKEEKRSSR